MMGNQYKFGLLLISTLFIISAIFPQDVECVYGILTPQNGKRAQENKIMDRKTAILDALTRREYRRGYKQREKV